MGKQSLKDRVQVGVSPIDGRGLYAARRFRKGAYIATFEGVPTEEDGTHVLWVIDDDDSERGIEGRNELRFLNHSLAPNAEFRGEHLYAIRNVQPGAELTFHYGDGWDDIE